MAIREEILIFTTAETLAKDNEFRGADVDAYLEVSQKYFAGDTSVLSEGQATRAAVHAALLDDNEPLALELQPELSAAFAEADIQQVTAANDDRNLDYYLAHGVTYELNGPKIDGLVVDGDQTPLSVQLMRARVISLSGFENVRINFMYHDLMDHIWAFDALRQAGVYDRYKHFIDGLGKPYDGFLFSKQSELISGIGYNTRRYLSAPDAYVKYGLRSQELAEHIVTTSTSDNPAVYDAADKLLNDEELGNAAGFVVIAALSSLIVQRSRWGGVKRMRVNDTGDNELTPEVVSLLDPEYLALVTDGVQALLQVRQEYQQVQIRVSLAIEKALQKYIACGEAAGRITLNTEIADDEIPSKIYRQIVSHPSISTSFYS